MHCLVLTTVEIAEVLQDKERDKKIDDMIKKLNRKSEENILDQLLLSQCLRLRTSFAREVNELAMSIMERYSCSTENHEYMEFCDKSEEVYKEYDTTKIDCFQLPEGIIVHPYDRRVFGKFHIRNGKVYETRWGTLKQPKRSKKAKRIKALEDYPINQLYSSVEEYAKEEYGYIYEENMQKYGYFYNPSASYDWFTIGGNWAKIFLVKETCLECAGGENYLTSDLQCPLGYKWVYAARKKDIEWKKMYDLRYAASKIAFEKLERFFLTGIKEDDIHGEITEEGIVTFEGLVYCKGETLETYLKRQGLEERDSYIPAVYGFVNEEGIEFLGCLSDEEAAEWQQMKKKFMDSIKPDSVVVAVDCHM